MACGAKDEIFVRSMLTQQTPPPCPKHPDAAEHRMIRAISQFQRHMTEADKLADAEARWGPEVEAAMGPEPDVGSYARRYERLAKDLPNAQDV